MTARTSSARPGRGNPDVVIFMGSDSDWAVMAAAARVLEEFGISHLAIADRRLEGKLLAYRQSLEREVVRKDAALQRERRRVGRAAPRPERQERRHGRVSP